LVNLDIKDKSWYNLTIKLGKIYKIYLIYGKTMEKNEIIKILEDWNFWKKDLETGFVRPHYLNKLKGFLANSHIIVITGARRSGKSFIMRQLAKSLIEEKVDRNSILLVNFEDPRFTGLDAKTLQKIYEVYLEFLNPKQKPYIFLDEIQEVKDWEKWVRTAHELNKARIIISGSNAKLLSRELGTLLTGRHLNLTVFPLSFREYLAFKNIGLTDRLDYINQEIVIKRLLREYLEGGSFPEVVLAKDGKEILLNYFEDIINKDIIKRYKIRKTEQLANLTKFYLSNISSLVTFSSLERALMFSSDTIEKFSHYLNEAYMLYFVKRFSFKVKEQEKSPKKVYAIDTGLSNTIGFRFSENLGRLSENLVFLELERRRCLNPDLEFYYYKDIHHREVDFVIKENLEVRQLIQVCWKIDKLKTKDREIRILIKTMEAFRLKEGLVITEDYEQEEDFNGKRINYIPLWKWLLGEDL